MSSRIDPSAGAYALFSSSVVVRFKVRRPSGFTPGQIDDRWTDEIEKDFSQWLQDHMDELPVPKEQIQELLKERTW